MTQSELYEKLSKDFPTINIEPLDDAVVIPSRTFKKEWQEKLEAEGIRVSVNAYLGQSCFFLRESDRQLISAR